MLLAFVPASAQGVGDLVVTEFMANPKAVSDTEGEYVEIYNRSDVTVDLNGFRLRDDGANDHVIDGSVLVAPGAFVILARSADPMGDASVTPGYVYDSFVLSNSADEIVLADAEGETIFRLTYTDGDAGGAGVAMEVADVASVAGGAAGQSDLVESTNPMPNGDFGSPGDFGDSVLPVELTRFTAQADGAAAVLHWATASETGNAGFHVLHRSAAGAGWAALGFVGGAGTTTEARAYRFETRPLAPGLHTFRLQQVDLDGTRHLSDERTVQIRGTAGVVVTGAHPVRTGAPVGVEVRVGAAGAATVALYNVLGQQVQTLYRGPATPSRVLRVAVPTARLGAGLYFLRVTAPALSETRRITVVR